MLVASRLRGGGGECTCGVVEKVLPDVSQVAATQVEHLVHLVEGEAGAARRSLARPLLAQAAAHPPLHLLAVLGRTSDVLTVHRPNDKIERQQQQKKKNNKEQDEGTAKRWRARERQRRAEA